MELYICEAVSRKLRLKHNVSEQEIIECFQNRIGKFARDSREKHETIPPTLWFISETRAGRRLKVVFLRYSNSEFVIKSVYEPNQPEEDLYQTYQHRG